MGANARSVEPFQDAGVPHSTLAFRLPSPSFREDFPGGALSGFDGAVDGAVEDGGGLGAGPIGPCRCSGESQASGGPQAPPGQCLPAEVGRLRVQRGCSWSRLGSELQEALRSGYHPNSSKAASIEAGRRSNLLKINGIPNGTRTRVAALKGRSPNHWNDGDLAWRLSIGGRMDKVKG